MTVMMLMVRMVVMVMATNTVNMEKMETNSARIGVVELDQSWPLSDEIKAILGKYFLVTDKVMTHLLLSCWYNVLCRGSAGVLGRGGQHGHGVPPGGAHTALLLPQEARQGGGRWVASSQTQL